eukprot:s25_g7.t1
MLHPEGCGKDITIPIIIFITFIVLIITFITIIIAITSLQKRLVSICHCCGTSSIYALSLLHQAIKQAASFLNARNGGDALSQPPERVVAWRRSRQESLLVVSSPLEKDS